MPRQVSVGGMLPQGLEYPSPGSQEKMEAEGQNVKGYIHPLRHVIDNKRALLLTAAAIGSGNVTCMFGPAGVHPLQAWTRLEFGSVQQRQVA